MAAPAATGTAIKAGALRKLGVLAVGETATAADDALAESLLDDLIDDGVTRGDMNFDKDVIPDDAKRGLIVMLAWDLVDEFTVPAQLANNLSVKAGNARREFRARAAITSSETTEFTNY